MPPYAEQQRAGMLLFGFSDPMQAFENWLERNYPDIHAQGVMESDTEALFGAIDDYYQFGQAEAATGLLPGIEEAD